MTSLQSYLSFVKIETSASIGAMKCYFSSFWEIMTDTPTNRPADGHTSNKWGIRLHIYVNMTSLQS